MSQSLKDLLGAAYGSAKVAQRIEAQERLDARRYIVRVIDARDDWSKFVASGDERFTAAKSKALRFETLRPAVIMRNLLNKQDHVKNAWIVFE